MGLAAERVGPVLRTAPDHDDPVTALAGRAARSPLRRQALAAMSAAGSDHFAAALGCHPCAETVTALAHEFARLIRPFHGSYSNSSGVREIPAQACVFQENRREKAKNISKKQMSDTPAGQCAAYGGCPLQSQPNQPFLCGWGAMAALAGGPVPVVNPPEQGGRRTCGYDHNRAGKARQPWQWPYDMRNGWLPQSFEKRFKPLKSICCIASTPICCHTAACARAIRRKGPEP